MVLTETRENKTQNENLNFHENEDKYPPDSASSSTCLRLNVKII